MGGVRDWAKGWDECGQAGRALLSSGAVDTDEAGVRATAHDWLTLREVRARDLRKVRGVAVHDGCCTMSQSVDDARSLQDRRCIHHVWRSDAKLSRVR